MCTVCNLYKYSHQNNNVEYMAFSSEIVYQHTQSALLIATAAKVGDQNAKWSIVINRYNFGLGIWSYIFQQIKKKKKRRRKKPDCNYVQRAGNILVPRWVHSAANAAITRADNVCVCRAYRHSGWRLIVAFSTWIYSETKTQDRFQWYQKGSLFFYFLQLKPVLNWAKILFASIVRVIRRT